MHIARYVPGIYPGDATVFAFSRAITVGQGIFTYDPPSITFVRGQEDWALNPQGFVRMCTRVHPCQHMCQDVHVPITFDGLS